MRLLVEIGIIALLIGLGWKQPYRAHYEAIFPPESEETAELESSPAGPATRPGALPQKAAATPAPAAQTPAPAAPKDSSWMWQKTKLDPSEEKDKK